MPESEEARFLREFEEAKAAGKVPEPPEDAAGSPGPPGPTPSAGGQQTQASTGLGAGLETTGGELVSVLNAILAELRLLRHIADSLPSRIRNELVEE